MATIVSSRPASSRMRWLVCALLFWAFTANYIDRSVFSNIGPEMPKYLSLDKRISDSEAAAFWTKVSATPSTQAFKDLAAQLPAGTAEYSQIAATPQTLSVLKMAAAKQNWAAQYWYIQVTFALFFALSNMYMGRMVDVIGLRLGLPIACLLWAMGSALQSVAPEVGNLFGNPIIGFHMCMALLALGQGSIFPAAVKATAEWFPRRERALATGLFNSGANMGGLLVPFAVPALLIFLTTYAIAGHYIGWRGAFLPGVIIDLLWIITWSIFYRKPELKMSVSEAELAIIHSDNQVEEVRKVKVPWLKLLSYRQTWAVIGAKLLTDAYWSFYLFSAPDFFHRKFGLDPEHRRFLIMLIYIISTVGSIAGGWLSGKFMSMGWSLNKSRKVAMLICALLVAPVFYAGITDNQWLAAALITLAASGHQAWMANTNNLSSDMFPKSVVGSVMGFAGFVSAFGMMTVFLVTGKVLSVTGNYLPMFIVCSAAYLASVLIVHLAAPKMEQVKIDV